MGCSSTKAVDATKTPEPEQLVILEATPEEKALAQLKILFDSIDNDSDGTVDKGEFTAALQKDPNLGSLVKDAGMNPQYDALDQLDSNKDGRVSWDEFCANLKERAVEEVKTTEEKALAQLKILFTSIDNDSDGTVDKEELTAALQKDPNLGSLIKDAGMNPKYDVLDQLDSNKDGRVSWDEFCANLKERAVEEVKTTGVVAAAELPVEEKALKCLKEVFDSIDADGSGGVSKKELASALEQDDSLRELIDQASLNPNYAGVAQLDTNNDGSVTWDEFVHFLKKAAQDVVVNVAVEEVKQEQGCMTLTCGF